MPDPAFSPEQGQVCTLSRPVVLLSSARESPADRPEWEFLKELEMLRSLHHSNIIGLVGFYPADGTAGSTILTEWTPKGSLSDPMSSGDYGRLSPATKMKLMMEIVMETRYCHSCRIVHRNLNPSAIRLDGKFEAKIDDFRFAEVIGTTETPSRSGDSSSAYFAPELMAGGSERLVDVFSFGVILCEMMTGRKAFGDLARGDIQRAIYGGQRPNLEGLSPEVSELLTKCWGREPSARTTFD
jgi:serine/threonine protein kinase